MAALTHCSRCQKCVRKNTALVVCKECYDVGKCRLCFKHHTHQEECLKAECRECGIVLDKDDDKIFECYFHHETPHYYCHMHIIACNNCYHRGWCPDCSDRRDLRFPLNNLKLCLSCDNKYCPNCAQTCMIKVAKGERYCLDCKK